MKEKETKLKMKVEIYVPVTIHKCGELVQAPTKRTIFLCWTFLHFRLIKIPSQRMYGGRYTYNKLIIKHKLWKLFLHKCGNKRKSLSMEWGKCEVSKQFQEIEDFESAATKHRCLPEDPFGKNVF